MPETKEQQFARELFSRMLAGAGLPLTETGMREAWQAENAAQGNTIANQSPYSPFWRLVSAIATKPALWLVELLVAHVLPNSFLRFASGIYLDVYAWGVDVQRKPGQTALGLLTFTRANSTGELTIPPGTFIESPALQGAVYRVKTVGETVIPHGALVAEVPVEAEKEGEAYNLGPGYYSILTKPIPGIIGVVGGEYWLTRAGADAEEDTPLRLRARNQFKAVGQLHHDAAYAGLIAKFSGIRMDYLFFEKDGPRGPGTANCHIMVESGVPPQEMVDAINTYVRESGNHGHGDDLQCFPITEQPISLNVVVYPVLAAGDERKKQLLFDVEHRIRCAFRQNTNYDVSKTYPLGRFSLSRLADELHSQLPDLRSIEFGRQGDIVATLALPVLAEFTIALGTGV
ncbi:baseplate J/gp47 family protein [Desulfovibrio cuneatus]|uniref:baseplate J/gp47 family protein n=1 Tax=Desulfovibrio cuneatus TaxID=159728 RepID=UPI00040FD905|nr:baseplate J/gp47 family protein [Desulfovibrio cuneatus]